MTHLDTPGPLTQCVRVTQTRTILGPREVVLTQEARAVLQQLGAALDGPGLLRVHNHGLVVVDQTSSTADRHKENGDGQGKRQGKRRSRQASERSGRAPRASRPAGAAPRIGGELLRGAYEGQVTRLAEAYPTLQVLPDENGMWLLAKSSIISGLEREATFLVALPYRSRLGPRAWGFWTTTAEPQWIGPRHTNFGDGSICAFSPDEGAWGDGDDLRTLLDLYTVWALRHLHLEAFGRWPGKQYSLGADPRVKAYYRWRECKDDELCGCGSETRRYAECCKPLDSRWDELELMKVFLQLNPGGFQTRRPPPEIVGFVQGRSPLPKMLDVVRPFPRTDG
jgi:hypothetical protein